MTTTLAKTLAGGNGTDLCMKMARVSVVHPGVDGTRPLVE